MVLCPLEEDRAACGLDVDCPHPKPIMKLGLQCHSSERWWHHLRPQPPYHCLSKYDSGIPIQRPPRAYADICAATTHSKSLVNSLLGLGLAMDLGLLIGVNPYVFMEDSSKSKMEPASREKRKKPRLRAVSFYSELKIPICNCHYKGMTVMIEW
jgi:hypothetical protein